MPANISVDCAAPRPNTKFSAWMGSTHIWIRDPNLYSAADWALLDAVPVDSARCFIRLEQWAEDPWTLADGIAGLNTDPRSNFTLGDSWFTKFDSEPSVPEVMVIHEGLHDLSWMTIDNGNFAAADLDVYEDLLFVIYEYVKTIHPQARFFECLNEPFIAINGNFDGDQVLELMRRNARAVARVNALNLPGPKMITAGPAAIVSMWENGNIENLVDAAAASPADWDEVKQDMEFWTAHSFQNKNNVDRPLDGLATIDAYAAANGPPNMLAGLQRTMTAYSRESNQSTDPNDGFGDDENPSAGHMAGGVCFFQHFHYFAAEYESPDGDRFSDDYHTMFAASNYIDYGTSYLRPLELNTNHQVTWAGTPGAKTPYYNLAVLQQMVDPAGVRVTTAGSGSDSWEVNGPATKHGVLGHAITSAAQGKVWVFISNHRLNTNNAGVADYTVDLAALASAGIDTSQPMTFNRWVIDEDNSNIGNGLANHDLVQTDADVALPAGATAQITGTALANAVHLVEVSGVPVTGPVVCTAPPLGLKGVWGSEGLCELLPGV